MAVKQLIKAFPEKDRDAENDGSKIIRIAEMFYDTIQGENFVGTPATFIRLKGCTLNCTWCFGIKKNKKRIPKIMTVKGPSKNLTKIQKNDILLTYDDNMNLVETKVKNIIKREVEQYYEIKINGKHYIVTPEHPFFTSRGLIKTKNLKIGDDILQLTGTQKLKYRAKKYNCMFQTNIVEKSKNNTDWKKLGQKISNTIKLKQKEGIYIHWWHTLNEQQKNEFREKISKANFGNKNGNYNGTKDRYKNLLILKNLCSKKILTNCKICNRTNKLEVHHIDNNKENDSLNNLTTICHSCHSKFHKRGYNFWKNNVRIDNKVLTIESELNMMNANGLKVEYIKFIDISKHKYWGKHYGPQSIPVINLQCEPYNTYIADNMWVHNCDTLEVWRQGNPYSVDELIEMCKENGLIDKWKNGQHLILTGGSPLLQQDALIEFIQKIEKHFKFKPFVEIENECTLMPKDEMLRIVDIWNNSPKLKNSGNKDILRHKLPVLTKLNSLENSWFKFVITSEDDWNEIYTDYILPGLISKDKIVLMPEGVTREELQQHYDIVVKIAVRENVRMTDRLHVTIWNKKTGV